MKHFFFFADSFCGSYNHEKRYFPMALMVLAYIRTNKLLILFIWYNFFYELYMIDYRDIGCRILASL